MFQPRWSRLPPVLAVAVLMGTAGCTAAVDVKASLSLSDTTAGWYDAGIVDGKNRIVPMVQFRVRKTPDTELDSVALNVVFRHPPAPGGNTEEEWDQTFVQNAQFSEGQQTPLMTIRTDEKGYTGDPPQSRQDLFKNTQFRDIRARVFAKTGSSQWAEIGVIDVPRELITR